MIPAIRLYHIQWRDFLIVFSPNAKVKAKI